MRQQVSPGEHFRRGNATAKLNGVDPLAWLTDVLERVVSGRTKIHELASLLPWTWAAANSTQTTAALAA